MPSKRKKSLQSYCSVDLLALMRFDMTFDVMLRDDSSFGKLTNTCGRFPGSLKQCSSICYVLYLKCL